MQTPVTGLNSSYLQFKYFVKFCYFQFATISIGIYTPNDILHVPDSLWMLLDDKTNVWY